MHLLVGRVFQRIYQHHLPLHILNHSKQEVVLILSTKMGFVQLEEFFDDGVRVLAIDEPLLAGSIQ